MDKSDLVKIEIEKSVERIEEIFGTGIFNVNLSDKNIEEQMLLINNPLRKSAVIEILINLRNLLYKCESLCNKRIDFNENVLKMKYSIRVNKKELEKEIKDITDVVEYMRNAVCHDENDCYRWSSPWLYIDACFLYNDDDIAFQMGGQIISMNKDIMRTLNEAKKVLSKYLIRYNQRKEQQKFYHALTDTCLQNSDRLPKK